MAVSNERPNIIFFFTDQQRWDTCGCYGQKLPVTPNLDRMAEEGVQFEHAFTCQPVCGPARACLQTGKYASQIDCPTNHRLLPQDHKTIAHWLSDAGYEVGYLGKWHLASFGPRGGKDDFRTHPVPLERRGGYKDFWLASDALEFTSHSYDGHMFDQDGNRREFPAGRYRADVLGDWTLEYLDSRTREQPFFLFLSFIEPHHQNDNNRYEGPTGSAEQWKDYEVPGDLLETDGDWRENYPDYLGCCNALDRNLGRIRDKLEELGIADNTLIIFTSDHGSHFRTRNGEYKRSCHDGAIRVPLVIDGPGFRGGKNITELVSLIDLPPTLLASAGLEVPAYMRGQALNQLTWEQECDWRDDVYLEISESHVGRALRTQRWKYEVWYPEAETGAVPKAPDGVYRECYLYDLDADPYEKNNLVDTPEYAEVRQELATKMCRRLRESGEAENPTILPYTDKHGTP
ncbi:MAG: sulfatase-like hydrolase/transferase [Lentisphaeria bacterium]